MTRRLTLDRTMVSTAVTDVIIAVIALAKAGRFDDKGPMGHIVVMDPEKLHGECSFEEAILYEQSIIHTSAPWGHDYTKIARAKACSTWETGVTSRKLKESWPLLAEDGDAPWAGSIIFKTPWGDIIIAFSAYASEDDEWICWMTEAISSGLYFMSASRHDLFA